MSDSSKVRDAKRSLDLGLRAYQGKRLMPNDEKEIIEIIGNCIRHLSYDEYRELSDSVPGRGSGQMYEYMQQARKETQWYRDQASQAGVSMTSPLSRPVNTPVETEEEKQDRIRAKERDFFFTKDPAHSKCDCGAAYTQFPNVHMHYCTSKKTNDIVRPVSNDFWD